MSTDTGRWSRSIDTLLAEGREVLACDVLVLGSGYGGSFAARELAPHAQVWVLERGREYALGEFPEDIGALPGHVRFHRTSKLEFTGNADALFDVRMFNDVSVLLANGLGGGSLINAGVALRPDREALDGWGGGYGKDGARRELLLRAMEEVEDALQAEPLAAAATLPKFQALSRLGTSTGCSAAQPVPVTIAQRKRSSPAGIEQDACIQCGNCFTGCNTGAKNTLATHVIPLAATDGARFYTGATALEVLPCTRAGLRTEAGLPARWTVRFARTAKFRGDPAHETDFVVHAHTVVLAAGALGSTELLLRSTQVAHSGRLGACFSTNGDQVAMGWGMAPKVNGVSMPEATDTELSRDVGPTITGSVAAHVAIEGRTFKARIQDGAVPSALAQALVVMGTGLAFAHRYIEDRPPAYGDAQDILAVPPGIARHALLLLGMGKDPELGRVRIQGPERPPDYGKDDKHVVGRLDIRWPKACPEEDLPHYEYPAPEVEKPRDRWFLEALDNWLEQARKAGGLQGGDLLGNPLWRPFPKDFVLLAGKAPRKLLTVHPLGGCGIADTGCDGVVDWAGTVFQGDSRDVHAGLHVLDGAIVPESLGVNPFLTIAALSVVGAREIRRQLAAARATVLPRTAWPLPAVQPCVPPLARQPAGPVRIGFEERLQGEAVERPTWLEALVPAHDRLAAAGPLAAREWIAVVSTEYDLHAWLANPSLEHAARFRLHHNAMAVEQRVQEEMVRVPALLEGSGTLSLLALDGPRAKWQETDRFRQALWAYFVRRTTADLRSLRGSDKPLTEVWKAFERAGRLHALRRVLKYDFALRDAQGRQYRASGRKVLAFRTGEKNLWKALTELGLSIEPADGRPRAALQLKVDLVDLVENKRLQVVRAPNTPAAILGLAGYASLWLRSIFTTHFWSFRGPGMEYLDRLEPAEHLALRPYGPLGAAVHPVPTALRVPRKPGQDTGEVVLELTCYEPPGKCRDDLLMIHGLAHGATVFTTDTIDDRNMATYFVAQGYRVWVLDHRLSNRLGYANEAHSIDDVAQADIPCAVRHVYRCAGRPIRVFAHCVGAAAFSMAALKGWLHDGGRSMIRAAAIHAVHPWVVPSDSNQLSAALAAFFKDALEDDDVVDPLPPRRDWRRKREDRGFFDQLIDRLGSTLPWDEEEVAAHQRHMLHPEGGCAICNRMTVFYGKEFRHQNVSDRTHEKLGSLFGPAGIEVFRHLYFIALRRRLTDREGSNVYLTEDNAKRHFDFDVLFCHGRENKVFDPRAAVRSWHRLTRIRNAARLGLATKVFIAPGYGHMDFLFGEEAHREVFPALRDFFANPGAFPSGWTLDPDAEKPPHPPANRPGDVELTDTNFTVPRSLQAGPLLQLRRSGAERHVVLWAEQRSDVATQVKKVDCRVVGRDGQVSAQPLPWEVHQLKAIQSAPRRAREDGPTLNGAGKFWVGRLRVDPDFAANPPALALVFDLEDGSGTTTPTSAGRYTPQPLPGSDTWSVKPILKLALEPRTLEGIRALSPQNIPSKRRPFAIHLGARGVRYDEQVVPVLHLGTLPWWKRWVGMHDVRRRVSWLASSCRWPGLPFEERGVDEVARRMRQHVLDEADPAEALVLLGDQIYVDATADVADTVELEERAAKRYRDAFSAPETRLLLASVPTYFTIDDHEYKDNFSAAGSAWDTPDFRNGFEAAFAYQWRWDHETDHLPRVGASDVRGFWHEFEIGNIPAFAMDTRTERLDRRRLLGPEQFAALKTWLLRQDRDRPKVICSGSVFGMFEARWLREPGTVAESDDWFGYPEAAELVEFIVQERIFNIVFLAGDLHLSGIAELSLEVAGLDPVRAASVACSGWNATLPFANRRARDLALGSCNTLQLAPGVAVNSRTEVLCDDWRQYAKLSLDPAGGWTLHVTVSGDRDRCASVRL